MKYNTVFLRNFIVFKCAKIFIIIFSFMFVVSPLFISLQSKNLFAYENVYAKIKNDNVFLYSQPINNDEYKIFCIPQSYFVLLTDNASDEGNLFFKAYYMDVLGYVKKNQVFAVEGTPVKPFADNLTVGIYSTGGLELKKSPKISADSEITVPFLQEGLTYYGERTGEVLVPQLGVDIWYYSKYISDDGIFYGYLYKPLCFPANMTVEKNAEEFPAFSGELFPLGNISPNEIVLSDELKVIVIICACLPCLFIIYLLFKPTKLIIDNGKKPKKKLNRLKRSEYYEFDE